MIVGCFLFIDEEKSAVSLSGMRDSFGSLLAAQPQPRPDRQVAITIDDLPAGAANFMTADEITSMTTAWTRW